MRRIAKVPVIMQMEAAECGAACLCMVLAGYGKWLPLEQVRLACGVSRDGSNAANLLKAARGYGLKAKGYRTTLVGIQKMRFPLIIHWNFNHFVVLSGFKKKTAVLCDPARGRVEVSMREFDASFTGVALSFEKAEDFVPEGHPPSVLAFAKRRLEGAFLPFALVAVLVFLGAASGLAAPLTSRLFLDEILPGNHPGWLPAFLAALAALLIFQIIVSILRELYLLKLRGKLDISANVRFMWHVLRLPVEFFSQRYAGDIARRQQSNESVAQILIGELAPVGLNVGMLVFYLAVMLHYSPVLTAIGMAATVCNLFVTRYTARKRVNIARAMLTDESKLDAATLSGIEMIETIKAGGAENGFFARWSGCSARVNHAKTDAVKLTSTLGAVPELLVRLAGVTVILLGAALILRGRFSAGMLLAFQGFLSSFMTPVESLLGMGRKLTEMRTQMERIEDVMNYPADVIYEDEAQEAGKDKDGNVKEAADGNAKEATDGNAKETAEENAEKAAGGNAEEAADRNEKEAADGSKTEPSGNRQPVGREAMPAEEREAAPALEKLHGALAMRHVTFGYSRLAPPLIMDFSLNLAPGAAVALVGESGCGKSTLAKLISGLYRPWSGEIRYDGRMRDEIPRTVFTGSLAVVDQDITLFADSVAENVRMWDRSIEDFEIIMAARDAQIHEDIVSRAGGYQAGVFDNGKNFSGGQCQRLEIARVLAQDPTIVILDEATSALDACTEAEVIRAIRDRGITCIIVAHRLSTIRDCDEIIVLSNGRAVERGTHEELYARGGLYTDLISME